MAEPLIPKHGGYRRLITYRLGVLIYDATVAFCARYIDRHDRTHDQMVQAAALPEAAQALFGGKRLPFLILDIVEDQRKPLTAGNAKLPNERFQLRTRHEFRLEIGGIFQTDLLVVERHPK